MKPVPEVAIPMVIDCPANVHSEIFGEMPVELHALSQEEFVEQLLRGAIHWVHDGIGDHLISLAIDANVGLACSGLQFLVIWQLQPAYWVHILEVRDEQNP